MYILLFAFWVILNGRITAEILILGLLLTAVLGIITRTLFDYTLRKDLIILKKMPLFICYIFVLLLEILKACLSVMKYILTGQHRNAKLVTFRPGIRTELGRFILANSITLTPGTITIDVKDGLFTVHCLSGELLDTSDDSVFVRWIRRLEA